MLDLGTSFLASVERAPKAEKISEEAGRQGALAEEHAVAAQEHAARATDLSRHADQEKERIVREGQSAGRHDEKATELEQDL